VPELRQLYDQGRHGNRNWKRGDDMSAKWSLLVLIGFIVALVIWGVLQREKRAVTEIGVPAGWTFTLPEGDAKAGRSTFKELRCYMCHNISLPGDDYPESKPGVGRNLRVIFAGLPKEYVAQCLVNVHTVVPDPCFDVQNAPAAIKPELHFLTVKELMNLVAFLKQMPEDSVR
jgi:hypothetical protein